MNRRLVLILALLFAVPLAAQTKHVVSKIDVRGNVPASIVIPQTALTEGRSYSDKDLDVAVARVRRLPFVYDARYSMEGETLVLEVDGVTRFFADLDANGSGVEGDQTGSAALTGGGRMFFRSGGVAEGRVRELVSEFDDAAVAEADYSHYGIAGTRLFAVGGISYNVTHDDGFKPDPTLHLLVGYPLTVRQTISAFASDEGYKSTSSFALAPRDLHSSSDRQVLSLRWTYDTTDDPFFARTGSSITAGPTWNRDKSESDALGITFPDLRVTIFSSRSDSKSTALSAEGRNFWSIGSRGAVFSGLSASYDRSDFDSSFATFGDLHSKLEAKSGAVTLGYALNLFDRGANATRQRVEVGATYTRTELNSPSLIGSPVGTPFDSFDTSSTYDATIVNAAYVLRRNFATVRLSLSYSFEDRTPVAQQPTEPFVPSFPIP